MDKDLSKKKYLDSLSAELTKEYKSIWGEISRLPSLNETKKHVFRKAIESNLQVLSCSNDYRDTGFFISDHPRDKIMANNLQFITDSLYADRKVIVWAHNAHISKTGNPEKWNGGASIGYYLPEKTIQESYVIGFYAREGKYGLGMSSCNDIKNKKKSFEILYGNFNSKAYFIQSKNIADKKYVNGIPHIYPSNVKRMYDATIIVSNVNCSQLINYNKEFLCE